MEGNTDLGQIFTSSEVANYMVSLINKPHDSKILEPCFGNGSFLSALKDAGYSDVTGVEIDDSLYSMCLDTYPDFKLIKSDFLSFSQENDFDAIIMNPPYIRHEKINELSQLGITKDKIYANPLFAFLPKTSNMYMYFVVKALDCLKRGGELIVIFPGSWENSKSGKVFKEFLTNNYTIAAHISINGRLFLEDALVDVIILRVINLKPVKVTTNSVNLTLKNGHFDVLCNDCADYEMNNGFLTIGFNEYADIRRGVTTGYNDFFINPQLPGQSSKKYIKQIVSRPRLIDGYSVTNDSIEPLFVPDDNCFNDTETKKYIEDIKQKIIQNKKPRVLYNKIMKGDEKWFLLDTFSYPSIIFNYFVRNRMRFIDNSNGNIVKDNFYVIKPKIDYYLLFALLNNNYTYCQLRNSSKNYGGGMLKIQKYDFETLKFPDITNFDDNDIRVLKDLARKLIQTGSAENIDAITAKISSVINRKEEMPIGYPLRGFIQQRLEYA